MAIESPFDRALPSKYSLLKSPETASNPGLATPQPWQTGNPGYIGSFISAEDLHRQPHSYMIVPHAPSESKPLPRNTKALVRWSRTILLLLRICSWLGTAGILVCVICIRPAGDAMDWFMRIPPPLALLHLSYSIYHLSRSTKTLDATFSATNLTMAAILDACFIPCLGLYVVLAHNQLSGTLDTGTLPWTTMFEDKSRSHIIVYSLFLLSITTGGLSVLCFCFCVFLITRFRRIARLPPDMNPLQNNLTTRRHRKAVASASTIETTDTSRKVDSIMAEDVLFSKSPALAGLVDRTDIPMSTQCTRSPRTSKAHLTGDGSYLIRHDGPKSSSTRYSVISDPSEERKNTGQHMPTTPNSLHQTPPELQHLRASAQRDTGLGPIPILPRPKYDFSNRSPRPLGMHPPTPRNKTPEKRSGFDVRVLRNIDGNSSAKRTSSAVLDDVSLDLENAPVDQTSTRKHYGDVIGLGRVVRNQARVISSGIEEDVRYGMRARMREVSGKVAEEGRAGASYHDF